MLQHGNLDDVLDIQYLPIGGRERFVAVIGLNFPRRTLELKDLNPAMLPLQLFLRSTMSSCAALLAICKSTVIRIIVLTRVLEGGGV